MFLSHRYFFCFSIQNSTINYYEYYVLTVEYETVLE